MVTYRLSEFRDKKASDGCESVCSLGTLRPESDFVSAESDWLPAIDTAGRRTTARCRRLGIGFAPGEASRSVRLQ